MYNSWSSSWLRNYTFNKLQRAHAFLSITSVEKILLKNRLNHQNYMHDKNQKHHQKTLINEQSFAHFSKFFGITECIN